MKKSLFDGLFKENPILVLAIGLCPALAVSTTFEKALAIGVALIIVLLCSSFVISLIRKIIPESLKLIVCLIVITTFANVVNLFVKAYLFDIHSELGVYLALIAVNYVIIERNISYSLENNILKSLLDSLYFGMGCLVGLLFISIIREGFGVGQITIWNDEIINIMPIFDFLGIKPSVFFISNAGAYVSVGLIIGCVQSVSIYQKKMKARKVV